MFNFMKKDKDAAKDEEKERKKKEKKDKREMRKQRQEEHLTQDELNRLDEAKKGLFGGKRWSIERKKKDKSKGDGIPSDSSETSISSLTKEVSPTEPKRSSLEIKLSQKDKGPKKGILKTKSNYGSEIPNQGVFGVPDDTKSVEMITLANEMLSGDAKTQEKVIRRYSAKDKTNKDEFDLNAIIDEPVTPEKTYDRDLEIPKVIPMKSFRLRKLVLQRQPAGDFGFTLRRGTMLDRTASNADNRKKTVVFAEPGSGPRAAPTGLIPGDRLVEINGVNVENKTREEIIELIKQSGDDVTLKVQPVPELCELSKRSAGTDGGEIILGEENVQKASLRRSGSMKFRTHDAKSDDQMAKEKSFMDSERVWLIHRGGYTSATRVRAELNEMQEGKVKIRLEQSGDEMVVDDEDIEKANPANFDHCEDLASLRYLNEASMIHTLRNRYSSNLIHTYSGPTTIIVNPMHSLSIYSEKVIQMFRGCKQEDMPPHVYSVAQSTYRTMLNTKRDQTIMFLGRSGSGKTTNLRHALNYLTVTGSSSSSVVTLDKLHCIFVLVEAFCHTRTIMNTNASRYTQLFSLDYDVSGQIASASIQVMMLEKTRLVRRPEGEPTFHIFYEMLAGVDSSTRTDLELNNLSEENMFMTPLQRADDKQKATQAWAKVQHALHSIGATNEEARAIYMVLAAIYHLGVAGAITGTNSRSQFAKPAAAQKAADLLGVSSEDLAKDIFNPSVGSSLPRGRRLNASSPGNKMDAQELGMTAIELLEGFVVGLYSDVVTAVVNIINKAFTSSVRTMNSITLVDSPGFQNPASCGRVTGATFEDLCHNYLQERLQLLFQSTVYTQQLDKYQQENIDVEFNPIPSPEPMIALLDKPGTTGIGETPVHKQVISVRAVAVDKSAEEKGLLWLLDEEAILPGGSDESFLTRLYQIHADNKPRHNALIRQGPESEHHFTLNHFQGQCPVTYNAVGWLKACRENPVAKISLQILQESTRDNINRLFNTIRSMSMTFSGSIAGMEGSTSLRRTASMRRTFTSGGGAGFKRKSVGAQVKYQVDFMLEQIRRTRIHFVHCIVPQHNAGLCDLKGAITSPGKSSPIEDMLMNVPLLRAQLRATQIPEAVRCYRHGFPESMLFKDFYQRFSMLSPVPLKDDKSPEDRTKTEALMESIEIDKNVYRLGLSQIFFKPGVLAQLEDAREEKIAGTVLKFQAYCRGYLARQNIQKLKIRQLAVSCIQRNVRKFMAIRSWQWWRLYTKVQPLLNVHRTEEELKSKDEEVEILKAKLEKIDRERNDYKLSCDKLETKLADISADLLEENTASNQAAELLENESAERLRLEKELRDLSIKANALVRKNEQLEVQVMQAHVWNSSVNGDLDDEDEEGDSIYKQKYERILREMEYMKKSLKQQSDEEIEQEKSNKRHVEKRLAEALDENEDIRKQLHNLKKKSTKVTSEMQDMKHHLDEQLTRNNELEKKQRRFDNELARVTDDANEERNLREKMQRERDHFSTENYKLKNEVEHNDIELESHRTKIRRLENELNELSSGSLSSSTDADVIALKRKIHELEIKLSDQEEELDEQAGTIQQLEQAKLRLEMQLEKQKNQIMKETEEKDLELEEMRNSTQRKLKQLEIQIEDEYEEKQKAIREKRDLERQLQEALYKTPVRDRDYERSLKRDLHRTRALLRDAQTLLEKQRDPATSRNVIKQLRNQLDDAEYANATSLKAKKNMEMEVQELHQLLDDMTKAKQDAEERIRDLTRQLNDTQNRLEDNEEEFNELMKKYKAAVQQQSVDHITMADQSNQISELSREKESLKEQIADLQTKVQYLEVDHVDKQALLRAEAKIRELESKLELEITTRTRIEGQLERIKDSLDHASQQRDTLLSKDAQNQEINKRIHKQLRDLREEFTELQHKEAEANQRKHEVELKMESMEGEHEQCQSDLKLAFRRIADLQAALEENIHSLSDFDSDDDLDTDSSEDFESYTSRHNRIGLGTGSPSRGSSTNSLDSLARSNRSSHSVESSSNERDYSSRRYMSKFK